MLLHFYFIISVVQNGLNKLVINDCKRYVADHKYLPKKGKAHYSINPKTSCRVNEQNYILPVKYWYNHSSTHFICCNRSLAKKAEEIVRSHIKIQHGQYKAF